MRGEVKGGEVFFPATVNPEYLFAFQNDAIKRWHTPYS